MSANPLARCLLATLIVTFIPSAATADNDGMFCAASGVIAFTSLIPGGPGRLIKIVRFDAAGIQPDEEIRISDDFQTKAMVCRPGTVEVYSWDHVYVLDITVPMAPKLGEKRLSVYGRTAPGQRSLGNSARQAEVIVLQSSSEHERFELVIARGNLSMKGGSRIYTSTDLVHRVLNQIEDHRRLFFGLAQVIADSITHVEGRPWGVTGDVPVNDEARAGVERHRPRARTLSAGSRTDRPPGTSSRCPRRPSRPPCPVPSSRARSASAAAMFSALDVPTSSPSSRASRRAIARARSSSIARASSYGLRPCAAGSIRWRCLPRGARRRVPRHRGRCRRLERDDSRRAAAVTERAGRRQRASRRSRRRRRTRRCARRSAPAARDRFRRTRRPRPCCGTDRSRRCPAPRPGSAISFRNRSNSAGVTLPPSSARSATPRRTPSSSAASPSANASDDSSDDAYPLAAHTMASDDRCCRR